MDPRRFDVRAARALRPRLMRRPERKASRWRSRGFRAVFYQALALLAVVAVASFVLDNALENMRVRGIQSGFGFLATPAGFDIGESLMAYHAFDPYWRAFAVGVFNTLRVALLGVLLTTVLGTALGVGRFSHNALIRGLCYGYVELFRNVPILLQLLMWYLLLTQGLPDFFDPLVLGELFYLSKAGLSFPVPVWAWGHQAALLGALLGAGVAVCWRRMAMKSLDRSGRRPAAFWSVMSWTVGGALAGWAVGGAPMAWSVPSFSGFLIDGGATLSPEFLAVLLGLTLYTSAFVAEIVRAGIASVPRGQTEAALALGLSPRQAMRQVVLPQALRVIIPPVTSQYLNLTKNSSLAVAIGYPDVVSVANTAMNQTGRAVECIAIIMVVYLTISLATSAGMGLYNRRVALKSR